MLVYGTIEIYDHKVYNNKLKNYWDNNIDIHVELSITVLFK